MNLLIKNDCEEIISNIDLRSLKGKRVLVTGATGLLGQYIVHALALANEKQALGCEVIGVSLYGKSETLASLSGEARVKLLKKDLTKPFKLPGKYDYVFHAAGYGQPSKFFENPFATASINVDAVREIMENYMEPHGTFVFFSSAEIYGDIPIDMGKVPESYNGNLSTIGPRSVYGESKRLGEALVASYDRGGAVRGKLVRISHVYGPGVKYSDSRVMSDFIRGAIENKKICLLDDGRAIKTYGYVRDVIEMILHTALHGKDLVYNVGGKDTMSIRELAERVAEACGAEVEVPEPKNSPTHIGGDPKYVKLDLSKITREMNGFSFTSLDNGLANTVKWFENSRK